MDEAKKIPIGTEEPHSRKIDRNAPAGSENSLGAESVRDGRPATDDSVVEAIDEEGPGVNPASDTGKTSNKNKFRASQNIVETCRSAKTDHPRFVEPDPLPAAVSQHPAHLAQRRLRRY